MPGAGRFGVCVFDTVIARTVRFPETSVRWRADYHLGAKSGAPRRIGRSPRESSTGSAREHETTPEPEPPRRRRLSRVSGSADNFEGPVRSAAAADLRAPARRHRGGVHTVHRRLHRVHQGSRQTARIDETDGVPGHRRHAARPQGRAPAAAGDVHDEEASPARSADCCSRGCRSTGPTSTSP